MFRQVARATGKCPPWHNVATDALRERREAIWAGGLVGLLFITFQNISASVEEGRWQRSDERLCWGRGKGQMWQTGSTWRSCCLRIQIRSRLCCADAMAELMLILCLKAPVHHRKTQPRVQAAQLHLHGAGVELIWWCHCHSTSGQLAAQTGHCEPACSCIDLLQQWLDS